MTKPKGPRKTDPLSKLRGGDPKKKQPTRVQPLRKNGSKKYSRSVEDRNAKYLADLKKGSGGRRTRKNRLSRRR